MKKFMSLVLALVMVLAMGATAFAADGSITIENTTVDQTYTIYKVFDATYSDDAIAYTYTTTGAGDELYDALVAEGSPFKLTKTDDGNTYYVSSEANAATISEWLKANESKLTKTAEQTATSGTVTFTGLDYGYYYVTSSVGSTVTIDTVAPDVTIIDKNDTIDKPEKKDDDESVELGQVVNYTVTEEIDRYVGTKKVYSYTFTDKMSAGLTFNKDVKIFVDEVEVTGLTVTNNADGFTVTVPTYADGEFLYEEGAVIKLVYSATVNSNAITKIEKNHIDVDYTNEDNVTNDAGEDEETVYTAKLVIDKVDGKTTTTKLAGAKFVLYKEANGVKSYYNRTNDVVSWVDDIDNATVVETDANGAASFEGLEDGTYFLLETKAPEGYNLLTTPVEVVIAGNNAEEASLTVTSTVENNKGAELPSTGGMGTTMMYIGGGLLVAFAVIMLATKRRMNAAD